MKRHDNTLYINTQGAYLCKEGTNVIVKVEREEKLRLPVHTLGAIVCFGNVSCSPFLMDLCGENGVGLSFHTENGRFMARVQGEQSGNVRLRRAQHEMTSNPEAAARAAAWFITAKIANCRTLLLRMARDHKEEISVEIVRPVLNRLESVIRELQNPLPLERIRGAEGEAGAAYFSVFDTLILHQKEVFHFAGRNRRPPLDPVNALLSFGYAILANDLASACESIGLDPQMGFLHADRAGRASLALDLMEELRPVVVDKLVLSLINRQQVTSKGFKTRETGEILLSDEARRTFLAEYQSRKDSEIMHPFLNEKVTAGLLPLLQARLLARWLRGELDAYPPYFSH